MSVGIENETAASERLRDILENGCNAPVRHPNKSLPAWFDKDKFKRGQKHFARNYFAMFVSKLSGLLLLLSNPSILRVLVFTGKSSDAAKAFRRYVDTVANMLTWYSSDITCPNAETNKSLIIVKAKHCAAARKAAESIGCTISQKDMALTQFGFMGLGLIRAKQLGITGSIEDVEGFVHFWRTIGYCMGIEDRFNICNGSLGEVMWLCEKISSDVYKPCMENPPDEFPQMSKALLQAMRVIVPFIDPDAFLEFTKRQIKIRPTFLPSLYSRFILTYQLFFHSVILSFWMWSLLIKPILNFNMRITLFFQINVKPYVAVWILGKEVLGDYKNDHESHLHVFS